MATEAVWSLNDIIINGQRDKNNKKGHHKGENNNLIYIKIGIGLCNYEPFEDYNKINMDTFIYLRLGKRDALEKQTYCQQKIE